MKFTPRILKENVNISSASPLREFFLLLTGILGCLLLIYILLGFTLDILVARLPVKLDQTLGALFSKTYNLKPSSSSAEIEIQKLLDDLSNKLPEEDYRFTVHIQDSPDVNAVALPGGNILIFSGLLKEIESENELSMILAHELGHFTHRDHLRGLGRGLVLVFISGALFGVDSTIADFAQKTLITAELKFSRKQEITADKFALDLLHKKYGHVAGATDFFSRLKDKESLPSFFKFLSTHPYTFDRVHLLEEEIKLKGYIIGNKAPEKVFLD